MNKRPDVGPTLQASRNLAIALAAVAISLVVIGFFRSRAWVQAFASTDFEASSAETLMQIGRIVAIAGGLAVVLFAVAAIRGAVDALNRRLWVAAVVLNGLVLLEAVLWLLTDLGGGRDPLPPRRSGRGRWRFRSPRCVDRLPGAGPRRRGRAANGPQGGRSPHRPRGRRLALAKRPDLR